MAKKSCGKAVWPACQIHKVVFLLGMTAFLLSGLTARGSNSWWRLNPTLVAGGDVFDGCFTPDGKRVVYRADQDTDGVCELYSVPVGGGTAVKLNGALVSEGDVLGFAISPDGSRVVYMAIQASYNVSELYSVPVAGGTAVKINGSLVTGGHVHAFACSPDGSRVVYLADQTTDNVDELYSVAVTGGTVVKLNGVLASGADVNDDFLITPDNSRVVYRAKPAGMDFGIYSVPLLGGASTKVSGPIPTGEVYDFLLSPDGSRVAYLADPSNVGIINLFNAPVRGGTVVQLSQLTVEGSRVVSMHSDGFGFSPDGTRVVYLADQDRHGQNDLYSVPASGGTAVKLSGPFVPSYGEVDDFEITPDSSRVLYLADQTAWDQLELFTVPIGGGTAVNLTPNVVAGGGSVDSLQIALDGSRVVYGAWQTSGGPVELFSVPPAGGLTLRLSGSLLPWQNVDSDHLAITPDSSRVVYALDTNGDGQNNRLYSVPLTLGNPVPISGDVVDGGDISGIVISPTSNRVIYGADQLTDDVWELFACCMDQTNWISSGGSWDTALNWSTHEVPTSIVQAVVAVPAVVTVSGDNTPHVASSLVLGGSSGSSVVELQGGAALTLSHGLIMVDGGVLRGNGVVSTSGLSMTVPAGAEIRTAGGERLLLTTGALANGGRIEAFGTGSNPAEIEFSGSVVNSTSTGMITGHDSTLRFQGGLLNGGTVSFAGGWNDVAGEIVNAASPQGRIIVSGGSVAVFYDDVANGGSIQASAAGLLQSMIVFFGNFSGNGVSGGGHVFIEGDARPGFSPGTMAFGGDVSYGLAAVLHVEIAGTTPGTGYDRLTVNGELTLSGTLDVTFINGFVPTAGMSFDVWDAGTVSGSFTTLTLPSLPAGLFWHTSKVNTTGELAIGVTPESYAGYAAAFGLTTPATGDQDHDGLPNQVEYALGQNPLVASNGNTGLPVLVKTTYSDIYTFVMPNPMGSDLRLDIEASEDLVHWYLMATCTGNSWSGPVMSTSVAPGRDRITLNRPSAGVQKRFYRLAVRLTP